MRDLKFWRLAILVVASILLVWILFNPESARQAARVMFGLLTPFVIGSSLAFVLNVPVRALERMVFRKGRVSVRRLFAMLTTFFLVLVILGIVMLVVIPDVVETLRNLADQVPAFLQRLRTWADGAVVKFPDLAVWVDEFSFDWTSLQTLVLDNIGKGEDSLVNATFSATSSVMTGLANFVLGLVFSIYMLYRKENLRKQARRFAYAYLSEARADRLFRIGGLIDKTFASFMASQCAEALILATMFLVSLLVFRFPHAVAISSLIAVCALVPVVGAFVACVVGALLIAVSDPLRSVWFIVLFLALQQIEGNLIYPRVVGKSVGLPAFWVLAAVVLGGGLFGPLGIIAGVPMCAVAYVMAREAVDKRLGSTAIGSDKLS
jgi:predicted PurR-regulated permease PerM